MTATAIRNVPGLKRIKIDSVLSLLSMKTIPQVIEKAKLRIEYFKGHMGERSLKEVRDEIDTSHPALKNKS